MKTIPQLQIALDYVSLPPAMVMAALVAPEVDIIEIGTPLCKAAGVEAIKGIREICPDQLILADFKTPDVGGIEAAMAFDAGADMITVIGGAALATVKEALSMANERGKEMLMELTGVRDIIARATEWRKVGVERLVYHREWDAQTAGRQWTEEDKVTIRQLIAMGFKVTVTGGLTLDLLPFFADIPASVLICGRSIRETPDPRAAAREMRTAIHELWSGNGGRVKSMQRAGASVDAAAQAIRWGVSELGLTLTMDGRDCPGCNSPDRFCKSSRTDIFFPADVDGKSFINQLLYNLDAGERQAVGISDNSVFFIDVRSLSQIDINKVRNVLSAVSEAMRNAGLPVNPTAALAAAHDIMAVNSYDRSK